MKKTNLLIFGSLLLFFFDVFLIIKIQHSNGKEPPISTNQKQLLSNYTFSVLKNIPKTKNKNNILLAFLPKFKYNQLYLSIYQEGNLICSEGSLYSPESKDEIQKDIVEIIDICESKEKFNNFSPKENYQIVFEFYTKKEKLKQDCQGKYPDFQKGLEALRIEAEKGQITLPASKIISDNLDIDGALETACLNLDQDSDCYQKEEVSIYKLDSLAFLTSRKDPKPTDLYRFNKLISEKEITQEFVSERVELSYNWLKNNVNPENNLFYYSYYPSLNISSEQNLNLRKIASSWIAAKTMNYLGQSSLKEVLNSTLDHYLTYLTTNSKGTHFVIGSDAKMAYNAFTILLLTEYPEYPDSQKLITQLADALVNLQQPDGAYQTDFVKTGITQGINYYPGESILALMEAYKVTNNERYLNSVEKAFDYYKDWWQNNKNTAFIPWHTQAYFLYYQVKPNEEMKDFIFEMNDWIIDNHQKTKGENPDYYGGFNESPSNSTASYLEGIADAYKLALLVGDQNHIEKYKKAALSATRFTLQTQYDNLNSFYLSNSQRALGGFRQSLTDNEERCDYTQHALSALIKLLEGDFFD